MLQGKRTDAETTSKASGRRFQENRLQLSYKTKGGVLRKRESGTETDDGWTEKYAYPDEHCKESENRITGENKADGCGIGRTGVVSRKLDAANGGVQRDHPEKMEFTANPEWWNYEPKTRRRHELRGFRAGVGHRNLDCGEITIDDASDQMKMIQETKNVFGTDREPTTPPG